MAVEVKWLVKDAILFTYVYGKFVEEDINVMFETGFRLIEESEHAPVHAIIKADLDENPSLATLSKMGRQRTTHPKSGWSIIVMPTNPIVRFGADLMSQLIKVRYRRVDSMEAALAFLKDLDSTIDWSKLAEGYKVP